MEPPRGQNKPWVLTQNSLDQLLALLDPEREQAGKKYELTRCKLVKFFEWRGCRSPEELTDETLNRVARKIEAGEVIRNLHAYLGGVARLVWLESVKAHERERQALEQLPQVSVADADVDHTSRRLECFELCLAGLPANSRELIFDYHREEKSARIELRKRLAENLGIPLNALRIRAHRIRAELEECVADCLRKLAK